MFVVRPLRKSQPSPMFRNNKSRLIVAPVRRGFHARRDHDHASSAKDGSRGTASRTPAVAAPARGRDSAFRHGAAVSPGAGPRRPAVFVSAAQSDPGRFADPPRAVQEASLADARPDLLSAPPAAG